MARYDYRRLRGRICEKCGTVKVFAQQLGLTTGTVSAKLTGKKWWTQKDIERAILILSIPTEQIPIYFFSAESSIR